MRVTTARKWAQSRQLRSYCPTPHQISGPCFWVVQVAPTGSGTRGAKRYRKFALIQFPAAKLGIELTEQPGFCTFPLKAAARYGRTYHFALRDRREAGRGGMGVVYKPATHIPIASSPIKVLPAGAMASKSGRRGGDRQSIPSGCTNSAQRASGSD